WECDLSRVVQRVQQHICSSESSCRKRGDACRFGYPKEIKKTTQVHVNKGDDGATSMQIQSKREVPTINNYSPVLLSSWRANMDIQLIGNAYGAAEYTAAYVSKAEPDTLKFRQVITRAVKKCDPNLPNYAILKRVANATLSIREVSAQETYYILLRELPLYGKSRQVTQVKTMRPSLRYYRVDGSELLDIEENINRNDSIRIEPVEKAYMNRPRNELFDDMTLATIVEKYELVDSIPTRAEISNCWRRCDGHGFIKLRSKAHVVRGTPWIAPDSTNANFCFAEIFLHKPWRTLEELSQTDDECIESFEQEQQNALESELRHESSLKLSRQAELDALKKSRAAQVHTALPSSEYVFVGDGPEDEVCLVAPDDDNTNEIRTSTNDSSSFQWTGSCYQYPIIDANSTVQTAAMDESQWVPFAFAMVQSRARLQASVNNATCEPMQMIIQGEGGSGKSWLIKHIVKDVHNVFCEHSATRRTSKRLLLLAHQGTAAFNIKGQTTCSALELTSFSRNAFSNPYSPMTTQKGGATKLKRLQEQYKDVHLVIIDEFSVISCGMLYWIDQRMREIWPQHSHQSFGGRDVVFTDDSAQLDPVIPHALATPSSKISSPIQVLGREIWEGISIVCTLTSQNQGKADSKWFEALRRLRSKCPTQADVNLFNSRYCKASEIPTWAVEAKHIAYLDAKVAEANNHNLKSCSNQIINIRTKDSVKLKRLAKHRDVSPSSIEALLHDAESSSSDRDRVVGRRLKIAIGAPVSLTYNMEQRAGLCNGTNGIVYDLIFSDELELPIILIQISDEYMGP
ncbi:hypothetical protein L916_12716, partial [Phytophthora nicotianae]